MINQVMQDGINEQINDELYSSYVYLAMSAYCEQQNFTGCAQWLRLQSQEEHGHALRLFDYLLARDGQVALKAIAQPQETYQSLLDVFSAAQEHEREVSQRIDALYELAFQEKEFSALVELEWFITEQTEEEKTIREIVHKFKLVGDDPASLLELDRELKQRSSTTDAG